MSMMSRAEQRLTPDVVHSVSFSAARLGRRGFDEEHVRAFCHQVEEELVMLLNERTALQEEVNRLRRRVLGRAADDSEAAYGRDDAHIQAVGILSRAQQTADHYVAEAQEYSRHLAQDARRRRDEILAEARSHADLVLEEAHRAASQAAQAAMAAPVAEQEGNRRELEAELAYLRTFSDVYRTHLRAYLDALLRNVDEWEHAEKSSLSAVRADLPRLASPGP
ncbi:MAG TPA: DivIVA domain-containing protein [Streptosporangiaceae bacterium]|nr:DivIVA domain-containing protein [Streptosporangiaceae bacterium]